jgi:hypothetical protein
MRVYKLVLTYELDDETGEPIADIHERGELDIVTKLGLLAMANDTLLHPPDE